MKVFASGSCRLVTAVNKGNDWVTPIHSMFYNFEGCNFLGKFHNTRQHIQFLKYLRGELDIPPNILSKFLTIRHMPFVENIRSQLDECEWFLFEICSLKLYRNNGFEVQFEHTDEYTCSLQTEDDVITDLYTLANMLPNKKLLIQIHFRPNIINDAYAPIEKREMIFRAVSKFCAQYENAYMYDPSLLLRTNPYLYDGDTHWTKQGLQESFKCICDILKTK
jgi:hypothetical protein